MFSEHPLSNRNADNFTDMPMRVFWRSEIFDELCALEDALFSEDPKRAPGEFADDDEEKWLAYMDDFLSKIPAEVIAVQDAALQTLPKSIFATTLRRRIRQAQSVLGPLPTPGSEHYPPAQVLPSHAVLLPWHLRQRLEYLLDFQSVPMVWIRTIQTHGEKVTAKRPQGPKR
jgi:hypothetical protein